MIHYEEFWNGAQSFILNFYVNEIIKKEIFNIIYAYEN